MNVVSYSDICIYVCIHIHILTTNITTLLKLILYYFYISLFTIFIFHVILQLNVLFKYLFDDINSITLYIDITGQLINRYLFFV